MYLLDANILIYAFRKDSPRYTACRTWLTETLTRGDAVLSSAIVEVALVRINTLPSLENAASLEDVFKFLEDLHKLPSYSYASTRKAVTRRWKSLCERYTLAGNDVNDAYLVALALEHGATLMSADKGFGRFKELTWLNPTAP